MEPTVPPLTPDLLLRHGRFVRGLARELLADEHAADDVVQETWLRFLSRPPRAEGATRAWLRSVTARLSIENLRSRGRRAGREERAARPEARPSVEEELAQGEVLRGVVEAVLALEEPYRTTVLLAYWRGWDAHRIARERDEPLATVRSRLQRAHAKLRERLDRTHGREAWALALGRLAGSGVGAPLAGAGVLVIAAALLGGLWFTLRGARGDASAAPAAHVALADAPATAAEAAEAAPVEPVDGARTSITSAGPKELRLAGAVVALAYAELDLVEGQAADVGVNVVLAPARYGFEELARHALRTDAAGRFDLTLADPGTRPLWIRVGVRSDGRYRTVVSAWEADELPAEVRLARVPHGNLAGTVVDEQERPLAGALVNVKDRENGERTVTADADGRFLVESLIDGPVTARRTGYSLLDAGTLLPLDTGGWAPLEIRMAPEATLRIAVHDGAGAGIEGVRIDVRLAPCERAALDLEIDSWRQENRSGKTDARGEATIEGLWARRKIVANLSVRRDVYEVVAVRGDELVLTRDGAGARPFVLAAGVVTELGARLDVERTIAGRVRLDTAPQPGVRVTVTDLGRREAWSRPEILVLESGADGSFAGRVRVAELVGPLRVRAVATGLGQEEAEGLRGLGYVGEPPPAQEAPACEVEVAADARERLGALELVLEPRLAITGVVRGRDGAALTRFGLGGQRLWAVPAGTADHGDGSQASAVKDSERFRIGGLAPGAYDLVLSEELESFYTFENFLHRFPDVQAGRADVELVLPPREEARIRVRVAGAAGVDAAEGIVLHRRLFASASDLATLPRAERVTRVRGASPWPAGANLGFTGIGGSTGTLGRTADGYDGWAGPEHALQPFGPGAYAIGLHVSSEGEDWFPQATPLLAFGPGEFVVEFEPLPAAHVRGRVYGDAAAEFLAVALVDERGNSIPVAPGTGMVKPAEVIDTSASGAFVMRCAPTGSFRLRAGTRAELERGEFRVERAVELHAGANDGVELRF